MAIRLSPLDGIAAALFVRVRVVTFVVDVTIAFFAVPSLRGESGSAAPATVLVEAKVANVASGMSAIGVMVCVPQSK